MSVDGSVEGGLAEPTELEPEQGSLDLASPEDRYTRADWEAATAAVLRKTKRMTDDDADALVWDKLTRDHPRRHRGGPARHARPAGRPAHGRAADPRRRLDIRRHADAANRQRGAAPRPRRRRDLALAAGRRRHRPRRPCSTTCCSTSRPWSSMPATPRSTAAEAFLDVLGDTPLHPAPTSAAATPSTWSRWRDWPRRPACSAWSSTPRWPTTRARPTCRSSATRWRSARRTSASSPRPASPSTRRPALMEFRYAATDEQFPQIAKLRAARRLWARVLELSERQRRRAAAARGDQPADDEQVRPLREHAPHHGRGLRRRRRAAPTR